MLNIHKKPPNYIITNYIMNDYTYKDVETFIIYSVFLIFITFIFVCIFTFIDIHNEFLHRLNKHKVSLQ